jgi:hypothetical protein
MRDSWKYKTVAVPLGTAGVVRQRPVPELGELLDAGAEGWEACGWIPAPSGVDLGNGALGWVLLKRRG